MKTSNGVNKQNFDDLVLDTEKRLKALEKRKRKRMRVSGARLKELQRIIIAKK